jgi:CheY-like chemotaxis protein
MHGVLSRKRVLIVEDEPLIALVLTDIIEGLGGVTHAEAGSLAEAMQEVERGGFDLAILDINLKGEMSYPAALELNSRGVPFFFVTGYATGQRMSELASVETLGKPYVTADIAGMAAKVLNGQGAEQLSA